MTDVGILAFGAYVPRLRLQRRAIAEANAWYSPGLAAIATGERAMANWDEDVITMAVEAGRDCLAGSPREDVGAIFLASTTHPFADRQNAGVVKEALNLRDEVGALDVGGSQRAATSALLNALQASRGGAGSVLCIASEVSRARPASEAELLGGDAAGAMLVGAGQPLAVYLGGVSTTVDFVDHFRAAGQVHDYAWEARWVREEGYGQIAPEAIRSALRKVGLSPGDVDRFVMASPLRGVAAYAAKAAGIRKEAVEDPLHAVLGEAGSAQPMVLLASALERAAPHEIIVLAGFGQGCDVLVFETTAALAAARSTLGVSGWLARGREEVNYMKFLAFRGEIELERGMRSEHDQKTPLTALYRNRRAVYGLVGGRCRQSGAVQFPPSPQPLSGPGPLEPFPLAESSARVVTHTADHLTHTPDPPAHYGAIEFAVGARLTTEFTDTDPNEIFVGAPMRMTFRIKAFDERRKFVKYFWKAMADVRKASAAAVEDQ